MLLFVLVGIVWVFFCLAIDDDPNKENSPQFAIGVIALLLFWWGCAYKMVDEMSKKTAKYLSKKVVTPTIVGVLVGTASYLITGEFAVGGGVALLSGLVGYWWSNYP